MMKALIFTMILYSMYQAISAIYLQMLNLIKKLGYKVFFKFGNLV